MFFIKFYHRLLAKRKLNLNQNLFSSLSENDIALLFIIISRFRISLSLSNAFSYEIRTWNSKNNAMATII